MIGAERVVAGTGSGGERVKGWADSRAADPANRTVKTSSAFKAVVVMSAKLNHVCRRSVPPLQIVGTPYQRLQPLLTTKVYRGACSAGEGFVPVDPNNMPFPFVRI